jgi:fido (protein-threonine AMPylation protein)
VSDLFHQPQNATPLAPEEMLQLIPSYIAFRSELNAAEQENIARAQDRALGRKRRMPGDVWKWAGKFRKSERNLGIPFYEIPVALRQLLNDARTKSRCVSIIGWC